MMEVERNIPLGERVYDVIKKMIVDGELQPNEQVPESVLAKRLGVSRSPVKAALTRLQGDGLVVAEAWKVPLVAPLDAKYITNAYQVRKALDAQCALQAIGNIPVDQIDAFADLLEQARLAMDSDDPGLVRDAFFLFQNMLVDHCDNDLLRGMQMILRDHLARIRNAVHSNKDGEWLRMEYWMLKDLLEALRARDAGRIVATVNNQHDQFVRWLFKTWTV